MTRLAYVRNGIARSNVKRRVPTDSRDDSRLPVLQALTPDKASQGKRADAMGTNRPADAGQTGRVEEAAL